MKTPAKLEAFGEPVVLRPEWDLPQGIHAAITTSLVSGCKRTSATGMGHFNLAAHVGDSPSVVRQNRETLSKTLALPAAVPWLNQVHGVTVLEQTADTALSVGSPTADACVSHGVSPAVCAVLTADCLPVLLCSQSGRAIAAVHAGWRGLVAGVIEATVARMQVGERLSAYIGPAIGASAFEVGEDVLRAFVGANPEDEYFFAPIKNGKYLANLAGLAQARLIRLGVCEIRLSGRCTVQEASIFYSHRAGQGSVGRFASLIWRDPSTT